MFDSLNLAFGSLPVGSPRCKVGCGGQF
jgi:hypothetical protein